VQDDQITALMFAVKVGSLDVVKLLAERSTKLFAMDSVSMIIMHGTQPLVNYYLICVYYRGMKLYLRWQRIVHQKFINIY
jgi:hypothetical protein